VPAFTSVVASAGVVRIPGSGGIGRLGSQKFHSAMPKLMKARIVSSPTLTKPSPKLTSPLSQSVMLKTMVRTILSPRL
jgi:hypothetical protein